jgi:hypothetical protein
VSAPEKRGFHHYLFSRSPTGTLGVRRPNWPNEQKNPKERLPSGSYASLNSWSMTIHRSKSKRRAFSHPDFTVGSGISPDRASEYFHKLAGYTAGRELTNIERGLTQPRRLFCCLKINHNFSSGQPQRSLGTTDEPYASMKASWLRLTLWI